MCSSVGRVGAVETVENHRCPRSAWVLSSRRLVDGGAPVLAPLGIASVDPMLPTELSTTGALSNDRSAHIRPQRFAESRWADPGHSRVAGLLLDPVGELGDLVVDAAAL